ncbi:MAG: hypothetical protein H0U76_04115 [Ktedonobacteraceae bacterium]|nr:hypothetical protein [Ktedonobacteraceae bacterium]
MSSITVGVSGDSPLPSRAGNTDPPGVAPERVDSRTLQIIEHLFPGNKGIEFLALLLRFATIKQLALPGLDLLESTDVAVITLQSIRELSKRIGWSYDTTEKYVVLFCQLRLLYKERHRRQITLHFPLSSCQLPAPEALDALHDYRPKVVQFARRIKKRFVLLCKVPGPGPIFPASSPAVSSVPEEPSALPGLLFQDICQILQQEVDSDTESRLLLRIEGAFTYRCTQQNGRLLPQTGDSDSESDEGDASIERKESTLSHKTVDSFVAPTIRNGRLYGRKVDSDSSQRMKESPVSTKKGDSFTDTSLQNGRLSQQKDDSKHETGDSEHRRGNDVAPNVNVIISSMINTINVNVTQVAAYLQTIFEEPEGKRGYYIQLHGTYRKEEAWLAATIETLVYYHRDKTVKTPGPYFYKRCVKLHTSGISEETRKLVSAYSHLTHPQLVALLTAPRPASSPRSGGPPSRKPPGVPAALLQPLLEPGRTGMNADDALQVFRLLRTDRRTRLCPIFDVEVEDSGHVVLLDATRSEHTPRRLLLYSVEECQSRLQTITSLFDLFPPGKRPNAGEKG